MTPSPSKTPAVPPGDPRPVILFDGVCNLCNAVVQWVVRRDRAGVFALASLQSRAARKLLREAGVPAPESLPDSIAFIDSNGIHLRSDAAMGIGRRLGFPYSLMGLARPLPRWVRDGVYDWVARNRYRWFGRRDTCMIPTPDVADRFLDRGELEPGGDVRDVGLAAPEVRESDDPTALGSSFNR